MERFVMECLEKFPNDRPPSVAEEEKRLRAIGSSIVWSDAEASKWWIEHDTSRLGA